MCVIVHQKKGTHLDKGDAERLWATNPDGGGFAFIDDDNQLQVTKTMTWGNFWSEFERARSDNPKRDFLLHMRIATHGKINLDNVHPFRVDEHTVMAHNGIIHGVDPFLDEKVDPRSDTLYFVEEVLPRLPENWLDDIFLTDMVEEWIGWSKLMFLTTNPKLERQVYRLGEWKKWQKMPMSNTKGLNFLNTQGEWKGGWQPTAKSHSGGKTYSFSSGKETSDDWDSWGDYLMGREIQRFGYEETVMDNSDVAYLLDDMRAERQNMSIEHGIQIVDAVKGEFDCTGCGMQIDLETAECMCWMVVCDSCWQFKAMCGAPFKECPTAAVFYYEDLSEKGQNFVLKGGLASTKGMRSPYDSEELEKINRNMDRFAISSEA